MLLSLFEAGNGNSGLNSGSSSRSSLSLEAFGVSNVDAADGGDAEGPVSPLGQAPQGLRLGLDLEEGGGEGVSAMDKRLEAIRHLGNDLILSQVHSVIFPGLS